MDSLMNVNPGAIIWTIVNFLIFIFILNKIIGKPMAASLKAREERIATQIRSAEEANIEAHEIMKQTQAKFDQAQTEINAMIAKGREQADLIIQKATEEAEKIKHQKVNEALREIERSKEGAIAELRKETAGLVIAATEKILDEKLDKEKHFSMIQNYIEQISKN